MAHTITPPGLSIPPAWGVPAVYHPGLNAFQDLIYVQDLDNVFMNTEEFGITIQYYHSSLNQWISYPVLFDDPYISMSLGSEGEFNSIRPQFQVSEARLAHRILKKDKCTINGVSYLVEDFQSDGVGVTTVFLRVK
jgi:hypothetical protein